MKINGVLSVSFTIHTLDFASFNPFQRVLHALDTEFIRWAIGEPFDFVAILSSQNKFWV